MGYGDISRELMDRMVDVRRAIHRHPELAFHEAETAQRIITELDHLGIPHRYAGVGSGVIGSLQASALAPTVALRAEMDALPGIENTDLLFASEVEGAVHACGHDAHVAMVLGAATLLTQSPPSVNVRFIFQPAEEKGGGSRTVIDAGALDGVDAIYAGHVTHHYVVGEMMVSEGVITAHSDRFVIKIEGRGGHGARPHEATDAVVIAGALISAVQTLVSREIDPVHPSVVTIGRVQAGTAHNVIADRALIEGSIRTTLPEVRTHIHQGIRRVARALGDLHNASLGVEIIGGYPPVVNTAREARLALRAAERAVGASNLMKLEHPSMGSEDFSYYLEHVPGCYVRFGARRPGSEYVPLHSPAFAADEGVLPVGASFFREVVQLAAGVYSKAAA